MTSRVPGSVAGFVRLMRSLRAALEVLAREKILVETGLWQPKYQQRTYADVQGEIENSLVTMPPYHARVRLVSGEHVICTHPAPQGLAGELLEARVRRIKRQMRFLGYVREAREVDEAIRKRQEG